MRAAAIVKKWFQDRNGQASTSARTKRAPGTPLEPDTERRFETDSNDCLTATVRGGLAAIQLRLPSDPTGRIS
jgi:hypothetical protein